MNCCKPALLWADAGSRPQLNRSVPALKTRAPDAAV
jgi:hypothetical protein